MGNVQMLLRQHVGAPCAPCVEVGAEVKKRYSHCYTNRPGS